MSQAVHHGDDQRSNSSYVKRMSTKRATAIHLLRSHCGQLRRGRRKRRAALRTAMNGQAKQKKLPAQSITRTRAPRKCTQVRTVARFFGARVAPSNP